MYSKHLFTSILVVTLLSCLSLATAQWTQVEVGIDYQEFTLSDPNELFVTRMDRSNTSCIIDSCIGAGKLESGREPVSSMASRYNDIIGYWGQQWGDRYDVVSAINGAGFSYTTDLPTGGQIMSGWYAKRFDEFGGGGFVWKLNRSVFIGECVRHINSKNKISYPATGSDQNINGINTAPGTDELIIFTPQYGKDTNTDSSVDEVLVELTRPLLIMPTPNYVTGYVREINEGVGSTLIPFDHVVLSANGAAATKLISNVSIGDEVRISQEITHYKEDCSTPNAGDYTKTYCSIGYMTFIFLKDGVVQTFTNPGANIRNPRTAVAYNDDYIFFIVCDGRSTASVGMTMTELGNFCKDQLGATWGINQDGGGSSTMWVNGAVKNTPSDGSERWVANGLMMIKVQTKDQSTDFATDDPVTVSNSTSLLLGPGTNYSGITTVSTGQEGTIVDHSLNGVFAKGKYWWKASFTGQEGWIAQDKINLTQVRDWEMY